MAKKEHVSETPATGFLRKHGVSFSEHPYAYEEHGGTAVSSAALGVPEHDVVKTLVMQDEAARPLIVLMHGDCKVSTKNLARAIGCKSVEPCKPDVRKASSRSIKSISTAAGAATWSASRPACWSRCWAPGRCSAHWRTDYRRLAGWCIFTSPPEGHNRETT
jgi:hypothetical protein